MFHRILGRLEDWIEFDEERGGLPSSLRLFLFILCSDRLDEGIGFRMLGGLWLAIGGVVFQGRGERVGEAGEGEGGGVLVLDVGAALLDEVEKIV